MRVALLLVLMLLFYPKEVNAQDSKSICYIKDRFFVQQVYDIYLNPQDYRDKVIQIEGLFDKFIDENNDIERYEVFRKTAGCCGDDGKAGFEFTYKKEKLTFQPGQWILVEARVAEKTLEDGYNRIYLEAISIMEKPKGKEFVM